MRPMQNLSPRPTITDSLAYDAIHSSLRGVRSPAKRDPRICTSTMLATASGQSHHRMEIANIISGVVDHSRLHTILSILIAFLCIPLLLILDILFFQFTRPSCAACANLSEFLTHSSTTLAYIQGNKTLMDALHIYKKHV